MDEILRSEEMDQIEEVFAGAFSYDGRAVYFPVRHHSPACAYHLKKVIEGYDPDCILVEGPVNANELLEIMTQEDTRAPIAIYYSYRDTKGYVSEEKEDYKCYYPFLDYSPELVAVREGMKRGVPVEFIDLPYREMLIASEKGRGLLKPEEKNNYNDDYLLSRNKYIEQLVAKAGLRSFDELWEKYFEINGMQESSSQFVRHMLAYCVLSRHHSKEADLEAEGCLSREAYMAERIRKKEKEYKKLLIVTGGFHTPALVKLSRDKNSPKEYPLHAVEKGSEGTYLMAYSMEACDSLNGYASGMPYPGYYQDIYEEAEKQNPKAFEETALKYLVATGGAIRKKEGGLSAYDEICAYSMLMGLASLRGKETPGIYELFDSVLSCFVKGEYGPSTEMPLRILKEKLTGNGVGSLCKNAGTPPIVQDFEKRCQEFKLNIRQTLPSEVTLEIFASDRHRAISKFFYQMEFLNTGFAVKTKGPNLRTKRDKNLIREIWKYKWSSQVVAALIDVSVSGASIAEACTTIAVKKMKEEMNSREGTLLLTQMYEMGMKEQLPGILYRMEGILCNDGDFFSLVEALSGLIMLEEQNRLYRTEFEFKGLIGSAGDRIIFLLPLMSGLKEEDILPAMTALKTLYQLIQREEYRERQELFYEALKKLLQEEVQAGLEGCIRGILYGSGLSEVSEIERVCYGYMAGTHEKLISGAKLFRGLFFTARDLVFVGDSFITMIDSFLEKLSEEDFMAILPELRMAFGYFTPREIDEIARKAAVHHGIEGKELLALQEISPFIYKYGKELNDTILEKM
ncbi:DUF5682 family protein [Anaerocolumna xylanovorans]|uniref:Uncharacterized protein n=1 Tax=Anaerocolumna xylanovorans DSM 12503 TaxID=1121345 RepID=A0A1M7XYF2_9FIRM|nr:DUF5682 family protein [Anaerocolumna xylanovorans]SHO44075.1 hypothetical protein SAMN02745217_00456 [Anaerocolumna xylanovorans DSM 12503]